MGSSLAAKTSRQDVTPQLLLAAAKKGEFPPVTLLVGAEEYLIRQTVKSLLDVLVTADVRDFDFTHLRADNLDGNALWNALTTLPLLAPGRIVVLDNPAKLEDRALERLAKYCERPAPTTTLLLVQIVEERSALDLPLEHIAVCEFASVQKNLNRSQWAGSYVQRFGKKLSREALDYLLSSSSADIGDLASKLDAAVLYVGDEQEIDSATIMKVSGVTTTFTPWDFENAILKSDVREALGIGKSFLDGGEKLPVLLSYHRRFLLMLWQISTIIRKFTGSEQAAQVEKLMGRKKFKFNDFKNKARSLGEPKIRLLVEELLEVEATLKSRSGEEGAIRHYYEWLCHITENAANSLEPGRLLRSSLGSP